MCENNLSKLSKVEAIRSLRKKVYIYIRIYIYIYIYLLIASTRNLSAEPEDFAWNVKYWIISLMFIHLFSVSDSEKSFECMNYNLSASML